MKLPPYLYTADQVKSGERLAANVHGLDMYQLMGRAGKAVYEFIEANYAITTRILVVCGGGNNGGDGYVVARLAREAGYQVTVWAIKSPDDLVGDAKTAYQAFVANKGQCSEVDNTLFKQTDLVVDALLGTGFQGELKTSFATLIETINRSKADVIAVDVPSGLYSDTGAVGKAAIQADHTITFIGVKQGLVTGKARSYTGDLYFRGLGVDRSFDQLTKSSAAIINSEFSLRRDASSHKGSHGKALLIGGADGLGGAILLASKACLRTGTGLTACLLDKSNLNAGLVSSPEVMFSQWNDRCKDRLDWCDVVALGPGLSFDDVAASYYSLVADIDKPKVLDADALTFLAKQPNRDYRRIITPHPGEAARLLETSVEAIESNRFKAIIQLQKKYGGVVVLKGAGTLVADGKHIYVCHAGNAGMATGGMGDVLTGVITSLLAQGFELVDAAKCGVLIHSQAADLDVGKSGMIGLTASDVVDSLRAVINLQ